MDMETVQMVITPSEQDLQDGVEMRQRGLATYKHPAPDEWADAAQDDPQLVDVERYGICRHTLSVTHSLVLLKGFPRYLALSKLDMHERLPLEAA
jgi:hypothetical protein